MKWPSKLTRNLNLMDLKDIMELVINNKDKLKLLME